MTDKNTGGNAAENLTVRDHFAAMAMKLAYESNMRDYFHPDHEDAPNRRKHKRTDFCEEMWCVASEAYDMANAMMEERKRRQEKGE